MFAKQLGKTLRVFREERGLTIDQLARILFLKFSDVESIEQGNYYQIGSLPTIKQCLQKYLEFAGVDKNKIEQIFFYLEENSFYYGDSINNKKKNPSSKQGASSKILRNLFAIIGGVALLGITFIFLIPFYKDYNGYMTDNDFRELYKNQLKKGVESEELSSEEHFELGGENPINSSDIALNEMKSIEFSVEEPYSIIVKTLDNEVLVNEVLMPDEVHYLDVKAPLEIRIGPSK